MQNKEGELTYSGMSVDEVCLLEMTRDFQACGYFRERKKESVILISANSDKI